MPKKWPRRPRGGVAPYRGAGGAVVVFFIAVVDENNQVLDRLARDYDSREDAMAVWIRLRDRRLRVVQDVLLRTIVA